MSGRENRSAFGVVAGFDEAVVVGAEQDEVV